MPTCGYQTHAKTKEELMKQLVDHAKTAHNLSSIPPDVMAKVTSAIKITP
jgi:predicted small metal-binding protein